MRRIIFTALVIAASAAFIGDTSATAFQSTVSGAMSDPLGGGMERSSERQ
jgi:hypothetical protein